VRCVIFIFASFLVFLFSIEAGVAAALVNGVDPGNLGQGDWIWVVSSCETAVGVATPQALMDYEAGKGMQWVAVKAGDGRNEWSQWTSTIINEAHAKGLKIFAWVYVYGNYTNTTSGISSSEAEELNVAKWALSVGGDGLIIDAESEYEGQPAAAGAYARAIKTAYPDRFLAHAPFPYISFHTSFPYVQFGTNCDAVMPQAYWADLGISVAGMVHDLDAEWSAWQNSLTGFSTNAIKPIIPIGQGWNSSGYTESAVDVTNFVSLLRNDPLPAGRGGYHGVSYWECSQHPSAVWTGMETSLILAGVNGLTVPQNSNATFAVNLPSGGNYNYQWKFNGANLPGATTSSYTISNVQPASAGQYSVRAANLSGCALNYSAVLSVVSPPTNAPDSVLAPATMANWWAGEDNGVDIFAGLNAIPRNGIYYTNGETGSAVHLDGASGFLATGAASLSPPWTLSLWVNRQNAPGASAALMSDTGTNVLKLEQYNGTRKVGVTVEGVGDYSFNYVVPVSTWTHLVFVDNGSQIQLYANGLSQGALPVNFPLPRAFIGVDSFAGSDAIGSKVGRTFTDYLLGSLDEIIVFHRALSPSEISTIYAAGSAGLVRAPEFTGIASAGEGLVGLSLRGQTGKTFTLYSSANLTDWNFLGTISNPTGATQYVDSAIAPQGFYRATQP
jgi:hypothetical protein